MPYINFKATPTLFSYNKLYNLNALIAVVLSGFFFDICHAIIFFYFFLYTLKILICTLYSQPLRALVHAAFFNHQFNDTYHKAKSSFPPSFF